MFYLFWQRKATSRCCFLRGSTTLNQTLHFFHPQIFRTGQVLSMQSKGEEERPPVDAGWRPWGVLRWHLCVCHPTTQQGWGLTVSTSSVWVSPCCGAVQQQPEAEGFLLHTYTLPAKPSAVEPENVQPALMQKINKNISSLRTHTRGTVGKKNHSPYSSLFVGPRTNFKGGHRAEGYYRWDICGTVCLKSTFPVTPLLFNTEELRINWDPASLQSWIFIRLELRCVKLDA